MYKNKILSKPILALPLLTCHYVTLVYLMKTEIWLKLQ